MRSFVALITVAACTRAPSGDRDLDAALDCIAAHVGSAAGDNLDLVPAITDTMREAVPRSIAIRVLHRLEPAVPGPVNLGHLALGLAEQGDLPGARAAALHALAVLASEPHEENRDNATEHVALVLAWAGDPARARQAAGGKPMAVVAAAEGAARAGNSTAAQATLDAAPSGPDDDGMLRAMRINALVWLGRIDDAKQLVAGEHEPTLHLYDAAQLAHNAMLARRPEATALLRAAVDETRHLGFDVGSEDRMNLLAHRIQLAGDLEEHGDHADATALRAAIASDLQPGEAAASYELAVVAELAHASGETDALLAHAGSGDFADNRAAIAALRGDFKTALALAPQLAPDALVFVWERIASNATPQLAADLRKAGCHK